VGRVKVLPKYTRNKLNNFVFARYSEKSSLSVWISEQFQVLLIYMDIHQPLMKINFSVWGMAIVQIIRQRSDFIDFGVEDNVLPSSIPPVKSTLCVWEVKYPYI
jgi:hypothetical protein